MRAATLETPFVDNALKTAISAMPENPPLLVYGETAGRSFVKALVWRLTAAVVTLVSRVPFGSRRVSDRKSHRLS